MQMVSAILCVITQSVVVIPFRRFGTTYRSQLQCLGCPRRLKDGIHITSRNVGGVITIGYVAYRKKRISATRVTMKCWIQMQIKTDVLGMSVNAVTIIINLLINSLICCLYIRRFTAVRFLTKSLILLYLKCPQWQRSIFHINLLKTKRNLLYISNQSVPRSKHFPPRL